MPEFERPVKAASVAGPTRTPEGEPWVRWQHPGWAAAGSRTPNVKPGRFWDVVTELIPAVTDGTLDRAQTGRGVLAAGALGATLRSGFLQKLLLMCLQTEPGHFVATMGEAMAEARVYVGSTERAPSGAAIFEFAGTPILGTETLRRVIMPSGLAYPSAEERANWTVKEKARARLWVSSLSKLLRHERIDAVQAAFSSEVLPMLLTDETRAAIRWPESGIGDAWQYTKEQQALWALALVLSYLDRGEAEVILTSAARAAEDPAKKIFAAEQFLWEAPNPNLDRAALITNTIALMKEIQWLES
jgi:hypothetical protein